MIIHMLVAFVLWMIGYVMFGRFISPRWKVAGKFMFYLGVAWALASVVGHWALVWIVGHPLLGIGGHVWWCNRNGINSLTCQPRDKYLALRPWADTDGFGGAGLQQKERDS